MYIYMYIYIYIWGFIATGSFPKGNQGCQGADWSEPLLQSHQGSKGGVIIVLPAMPVWRDISSDEEIKERGYMCCWFFLIILAHSCLFAGSIHSQWQAAFLLGCCNPLPGTRRLLGWFHLPLGICFLSPFLDAFCFWTALRIKEVDIRLGSEVPIHQWLHLSYI